MSANAGQRKTGGGAPKKESILELAKLMDATVRVKCIGGRELQGVLRGYDDLVNLVLDECEEFLRGASRQDQSKNYLLKSFANPFLLFFSDPEDIERVTDKTRKLGLIVVRGTQVSLVSPQDGMEEIANPFVTEEE
jgi:U6 snRNA-associated Sm-like protein LSm7